LITTTKGYVLSLEGGHWCVCIIKTWSSQTLISEEKIRVTIPHNPKDDEKIETLLFILCKETCEKWVFIICAWI